MSERMTTERFNELKALPCLFGECIRALETEREYARDLEKEIMEHLMMAVTHEHRITELETENKKYSAGMQENCQLRKRMADLEEELGAYQLSLLANATILKSE